MERIVVYGSINADRICQVGTIVPPGATVRASGATSLPGGKGANQAVAAALAGAPTALVGSIGPDGEPVLRAISDRGVDVQNVQAVEQPTGAAFIQVDPSGENAIVVDPSANHALDDEAAHALLECILKPNDLLLLQNEATGLAGAIRAGTESNAQVWLNAAPSEGHLRQLPLEQLDALLVNEEEARQLAEDPDPLAVLSRHATSTLVVLTRGAAGGCARLGEASYEWRAHEVDAIDTVGCGDAFIGVLAASLFSGMDLAAALERAACAAAITATRAGGIPALPDALEIASFSSAD